MSDLIEREEAIDYFVTNIGVVDEDGYAVDDYDERVKIWTERFSDIPSAEPERKWISTTDRLPENNQRVLVSIIRSDGAKRVRTGSYSSNEYFWIDNGDYWKAKEVQAWMPLPEPWKGER